MGAEQVHPVAKHMGLAIGDIDVQGQERIGHLHHNTFVNR